MEVICSFHELLRRLSQLCRVTLQQFAVASDFIGRLFHHDLFVFTFFTAFRRISA